MNTCLDGDFERKLVKHSILPHCSLFSIGRCVASIDVHGELKLILNPGVLADAVPIWFMNFGHWSNHENVERSLEFFFETSPYAKSLCRIERHFLHDVIYISRGFASVKYLYTDHNPYVRHSNFEMKDYRDAGYEAILFSKMDVSSDLLGKVDDFYVPHDGSHIRHLISNGLALLGEGPFKSIPDDLLELVTVEKFI